MRRANTSLLRWLQAAAVGFSVYLALSGLGFAPGWGAVVVAAAAGALTLASTDLGIAAAVVALGLTITAASPVLGIAFLVVGLLSLRFLGAGDGEAFFVLAGALAGAFFGPVWAAPALAGFFLGPGPGAAVAAFAALAVEVLGIALGRQAIGAVATGGGAPLLDPAAAPESMLDVTWVADAIGRIDGEAVERFTRSLSAVDSVPALVVQALLWAAAAAAAGWGAQALRREGRARLAPVAAALGALVPAVGAIALGPLVGVRLDSATLAIAAVSSTAVAAAIAWAFEVLFPIDRPVAQAVAVSPTMATEDADVDELLSLIATAEDRLTEEHTVQATVLITDMKSFSRMTEEEGSIQSAKAIQRHRDLLLPVIRNNGGRGKSTGGDGLLAAFDEPARAVAAAQQMQRTLAEHNLAHPDERAMTVRIGIATGEVVCDKNGRPFIGNALNVAARVMNLADGGQVLATREAVAGTDAPALSSHGHFGLRNIVEPVEIVEVLWRDDQAPRDPRVLLGA